MNPFYIYLWGMVDDLKSVILPISILSTMVFLVTSIGLLIAYGEGTEDDHGGVILGKRIRDGSLRICITSAVLMTFVPSSKTIACMVILPRIAESQAIQKDLPDLYNIAIDALKKSLAPEQKK